MEIIQQINELIENNKSLKEENCIHADILDEKDEEIKNLKENLEVSEDNVMNITAERDELGGEIEELKKKISLTKEKRDDDKVMMKAYEEEIKKLNISLAQKTNEVDTHQSRLSDDMNGLRNKLANREKQIEELKGQITIKPNHMVAKDNEIAVLKVKIKKLEESSSKTYIDEFMKSINQSGYVKHGIMIGRYNNGKAKRKSVWVSEEVAKYLDEYPQVNKIAARGDVIA